MSLRGAVGDEANVWLRGELRSFKTRETCKRGVCFALSGLAMTLREEPGSQVRPDGGPSEEPLVPSEAEGLRISVGAASAHT